MSVSEIIKESFSQYAGAVLQSRAFVDVRDCLKPSTRQILYCMYKNNRTHDKPAPKTATVVGDSLIYYIHGDASAEGIIMRAGQPFNMRYPLIEVKGNGGSMIASGNWAATRYTSCRLSEISSWFFKDINKDSIEEWRENHDGTDTYPSVVPSKGFYNIVNGSFGIGIGLSCSIPQFNIKEVNKALIKLLWNPDATFDELYCVPDFATGGTIINESEVKESLRKGNGKAIMLRAVMEYDSKDRCFIVTEMPYGTYTNNVIEEINKIVNDNPDCGIERVNDLTKVTPLLKIYLTKNANPTMIKYLLYKKTSLQNHFGVNMIMLKDGKKPKQFTWKEALQEFLKHQKEVYKRSFEYDKKLYENKILVLNGIIVAIKNIDDVIEVIKSSSNKKEAVINLCENFELVEAQAEAILNIRLSKLSKLEIDKINKELKDYQSKLDNIILILSNEKLFKEEIEKGLIDVINKYGDDRRTKVENLVTDGSSISQNNLLYITNKGIVVREKTKDTIRTVKNNNGDKYIAITKNGKIYVGEIKKRIRRLFENKPEDPIIKICEYNEGYWFKFWSEEKLTVNIPFNSVHNAQKLPFIPKYITITSKECDNNEYMRFLVKENLIF